MEEEEARRQGELHTRAATHINGCYDNYPMNKEDNQSCWDVCINYDKALEFMEYYH